MEISYWQSRWKKDNIGFHMPGGYSQLRTYWPEIASHNPQNVLVPLCGKSEDLGWLVQHVKKVIGVEVSEKAVNEFFDEHQLPVRISSFADFKIYRSENIEIWCGNFFKLPVHKLPAIDLIYDKAALVALPKEMRKEYAEKIKEFISSSTVYALHHFIYPQHEMNGPPFSVETDEVGKLFSELFDITILFMNSFDPQTFEKFTKRGLKSTIIEQFLLLKHKKQG